MTALIANFTSPIAIIEKVAVLAPRNCLCFHRRGDDGNRR
jgi:hypothetical protein